MLSQINSVIFHTTQLIQVIIFTAGCYFFGISIFGWLNGKRYQNKVFFPNKRFALIVAAHNEEKVITHIIDSLLSRIILEIYLMCLSLLIIVLIKQQK